MGEEVRQRGEVRWGERSDSGIVQIEGRAQIEGRSQIEGRGQIGLLR